MEKKNRNGKEYDSNGDLILMVSILKDIKEEEKNIIIIN